MTADYDWIAFDADDTLWHNELLFRITEDHFDQRLYATEMRNLEHLGYGIKAFVLSMIETSIELTEGRITGNEIAQIIAWGHDMLRSPVELLPGVQKTIATLARSQRLMLLTKGDLLDQERKLARSGLGDYFSALEIVAHKTPETYRAILERRQILPGRFLMIGNSLKSDILPVLAIGGNALHIPYDITWLHEWVPEEELIGKTIHRLAHIAEVITWLQTPKNPNSNPG
jgi:putative hydrolase of the HAD superfamily